MARETRRESIGGSAPVALIAGGRFIRSVNGRHTVIRRPDGGLEHETSVGSGASLVSVILADEARGLERPGTELTWRFLKHGELTSGAWLLVLVDADNELRWLERHGDITAESPSNAVEVTVPSESAAVVPTAGPMVTDGPYSNAWMDVLDMDSVYCVTAIHDVTPDEALRRFGAQAGSVFTGTWQALLERAEFDEAYESITLAAFAIGPHTLVVEDNGWEGVNRPDLSVGTFAVSSYRSINADKGFVVSRDGEVLAALDENAPSSAEGADPGVLKLPLAEMGITDPVAYDSVDDNFIDDLELLCRVARIRPTVAETTGPARVAIFGSKYN